MARIRVVHILCAFALACTEFAQAIRNPRSIPSEYLKDSLGVVRARPAQPTWATRGVGALGNSTLTRASKLWTYNASDVWNVPQSVDWAGSPLVPPVIHHGNCGSCFAAAAKDALESAFYRETGQTTSISMQDMLDCSWQYQWKNETNAGCNGGAYQASFDWARDNGVVPAQYAPYANNDSTCDPNRTRHVLGWKPVGWVEVPDDEALIMHALAYVGPLAVSMLTAYPAFDGYQGKGLIVVPPANCTAPVPDAKLDHSMLLVGYGTSPFGVPYWKVKNNWGADWGDVGYYYLWRGRDCGIRTSVAYVV